MTTNIFERLWAWIKGEAKQLPTIENKILDFADTVTNDIKAISESDLPKYLETLATVAESIDPALTPLISGLELYIPKAVGLITGVLGDISAAIKALQSVKSVDAVVYAGNLGTLKAAISNFVLSNNAVSTGVLAPPAGNLIAVSLATHDTPAAE
jgi:hypothetical protein